MYVVNSESVLTRYVNHVQIHYVVSERKNAVNLIEHINSYYMHEGMQHYLPARGCVSCYISVGIFSLTSPCRLIVEKHSLEIIAYFWSLPVRV